MEVHNFRTQVHFGWYTLSMLILCMYSVFTFVEPILNCYCVKVECLVM